LQKSRIRLALKFGDALVIAVVVRIDVNEAVKGLASLFRAAGGEIQVE